MSERADHLLAALLLVATAAAGALAGAVVEIGLHGALELGAVAVGVASACVLFAFEIRHLPPAAILLSAAVLSSAVAFVRVLYRVGREQRHLRRLPTAPLPPSAAGSLGGRVAGLHVELIPSQSVNAFCAGIVRPRVLVTRGLLERLDSEEQRAALSHELEHAASHGPLKVALARIATRTLFWFPALGDLLERYILLSELEADRAAVATTSRSALAGALLEVVESPGLAGAVGLSDFAGPRIDRLFDPQAALPPLFRRSSVCVGAAVVSLVAFLVVSAPHLGVGESAQLHSMSVQLLAHRLGARVAGLAETCAVLGAALVLRRRFATRRS